MKRLRDVQWKDDRGEGSIFFFVDADTGRKVSGSLYASYRASKREIVISTRTDDLADAKKELRRRLVNRANANAGKETLVVPRLERLTLNALLDANLARAQAKGLLDLYGYERKTEILKRLLGSVRAIDYRPEHTDNYLKRRMAGEGSKRGAKVGPRGVRKELEILRAAFAYALKRGTLNHAPFVELPPIGDNVRSVEVPVAEFSRILAAIEDTHVRDFVSWLLLTAMRPGAVRGFLWAWFDAKSWTLRVPADKRGRDREFSIEGSLRRVIERRIAARRLDSTFIFHDGAGRALDARRVRRAFYAALTACELPTGKAGFVLYDTKKTATGLLLDAGLSDAEAMDFSGHRTASMLHRYRTKTAKRHGASVRKRDAYLAKVLAENQARDAERSVIPLGKLVAVQGFEPRT